MRYEWDERKNRENQRRHDGISFELATRVFEDERRLLSLDRVDDTGEQRWHALPPQRRRPAAGGPGRCRFARARGRRRDGGCACLQRGFHGEEIVRIISARWAGNDDYRRYQEQEMD